MLDHNKAWETVLGQLALEMPRAAFDTWVRSTRTLSFDGETLVVGAHNADARDWLDSRLKSTVSRLLVGIFNQQVDVAFTVLEEPKEAPPDNDPDGEITIQPVGWLDYERIVQPHRQVVVKGYLRRLGMEIGAKAVWLYIGFHQAAWMARTQSAGVRLHSQVVRRFSGLSEGAFWRLLKKPAVLASLQGLVERLDSPDERRYRRGRDGRPHRLPVHYQVYMTPRLTRTDTLAIQTRLMAMLEEGLSLAESIEGLLTLDDPLALFGDIAVGLGGELPGSSVMELARLLAGDTYSNETDRLAQGLHRKLVDRLGNIHLTHYFIEQVIPAYKLTPAQAWLVAVARDLAYLNSQTGERREVVTFQKGYKEMAALVGSRRPKTVQSWLMPAWKDEQRGADLTQFLQEVPVEDKSLASLRAATMPRAFRVLLDEPLAANGSNRVAADGGNSWPQMEAIAAANGGNMPAANGGVLNSLNTPSNTEKKTPPSTQGLAGGRRWNLKALLLENDVHPRVRKELLEKQASVQAFVSWLLYAMSPISGKLNDPLGYAISRLRDDPKQAARGVFSTLATLSPSELLQLFQMPQHKFAPMDDEAPAMADTWFGVMGSENKKLAQVRWILFGEEGKE